MAVLLDLVEPVLDRQERHVERVELGLVPARADAELAPAARDVVDAGRRLHEHADVPVADAENEAADPDARGSPRPAAVMAGSPSKAGLRRIGQVRDRIEVVPDRAPVEPRTVDDGPQAAEIVERAVLRTRVHAEAHRDVFYEPPGASTTDARCGPAARLRVSRANSMRYFRGSFLVTVRRARRRRVPRLGDATGTVRHGAPTRLHRRRARRPRGLAVVRQRRRERDRAAGDGPGLAAALHHLGHRHRRLRHAHRVSAR